MTERNLIGRLFDNPHIRERISKVGACKSCSERYAPLVMRALQGVQKAETVVDALHALHLVQRLDDIFSMNLQDDDTVFAAMQDEGAFPLYDRFGFFDVPQQDQEYLADLLVSGDPEQRFPVLLGVSDNARGVDDKVLLRLLEKNDAIDVMFFDEIFQRRLFHAMDVEKATQYGAHKAQYYIASMRSIIPLAEIASVPFADSVPDAAITRAYRISLQGLRDMHKEGRFFTLTRLPTREDAALDGMDFKEYKAAFMDTVKVDQVKQNCANRALIAKLNAASIVHITNNDGTDVHFDITGHTFANSMMGRNIPGSEVFSAPVINSVNGRIVAKGKFMPRTADEMIEDITLDIQDGFIVDYDAAKGREFLQRVIETDEGSRRFGEIGFGTNPAWRTHSVNSLLVEKIGGSFHMALGSAYQDKEYMGEPVNLDNGNRSATHWDITVMLHNKDGMIALDGVMLMQNGKYLDPELQFLNGDDNAPLPQCIMPAPRV